MTWFCFFADFDPYGVPCEPPIDRCHLIPKQRLRARGLEGDALWDPRIVVEGCRQHHHRFDNGFLTIAREDLPEGVEHFAAEHDVTWSLDRDYGHKEATGG